MMSPFIRLSVGAAIVMVSVSAIAAAPIANYDLSTQTVTVSQGSSADQTTAISSSASSDPSVANNQTAPDMDQDDANLTTDQKVARIENQLQYMMNQNNQAKSLGGYITEQQGQIEQLNYQVSQMQKQLAFVEQRVVQLEATIKIDEMKSKPATATMSAIPANKQESALFQSAYNALMQKQYSQAINGFNNFLKNYPNSTLVPDAHYWLGELYLVQGQPDKASQQFRFVVKNPKSDKAPDAMLKLGMIFLAYGDSAHAKETFQKVMSLYPNSNAAQLAKTQLSSM